MAPEHVLLVDDDPGYLETLCPYLRASGFCVTTADNGHDARQVATTGVFDAVVSDLRMADVSGIDLLHGLREAGVCVPFIIVSGYGTVELTARAMKLGATDFLEKPVDADVLVQVIRSAISVGCPPSKETEEPDAVPPRWRMEDLRSAVERLSETGDRDAGDSRPALIATLAHGIARTDFDNASGFLASANALRCVATASGEMTGPDLACAVLDLLAQGDAAGYESCRDRRVQEALARLGAADGSGLHLSEREHGRAVGVSGAHLGRLLYAATGLRFRELRRALRLRHAVRMLAATDEHIRQIAYHVGYAHETQFNHEFRQVLGLSPREFRKLVTAPPVTSSRRPDTSDCVRGRVTGAQGTEHVVRRAES